MNIVFANIAMPRSGAVAVLVAEGGALGKVGKDIDKKTGGMLARAIRADRFEGKAGQTLDVLAPNGITATRVLLIGIGKSKEIKPLVAERVGAALVYALAKKGDKSVAVAVDEFSDAAMQVADIAAHVGSGARLASYRFDKYRTTLGEGDKPSLTKVTVMCAKAPAAKTAYLPLDRVIDGVFDARDLMNEPANSLNPAEFAARAKALVKRGLKVEVLNEKQMEKLGMGALLGVGRGSACESQLIVMNWKGDPKSREAPIAVVGKGVCFDSGGISLKPGAGMGDMKGDMGGAAAVFGLMAALAGRRAKVNVVGILGCVENMPGPDAQRPGDIVTSMSGKTIEVLNTDAEGRLVLADALTYVQQKFAPRVIIDLATLTGAIMVALGDTNAGLFCNQDSLAEQLTGAGTAVGETVWRMPLGESYDKKLKSKFADMQNIASSPHGGAITAAQFIQRFIDGDTPWAHIDIAGVAWLSGEPKPSWGTGFGVRLLDRFIADNYEK